MIGLTLRSPVGRIAWIPMLLGLLWGVPVQAGWLDDLAVGETHRLEAGTFYRDLRKVPPVDGRPTGVLPIALDRELVASFEYGNRTDEFEPVRAAVEERLVAATGLRKIEASPLPAEGAPRVYVGSAVGDMAPPDAEEVDSPADRFPPMVLHLERPSKAWQEAASRLMADRGLDYLVLANLGVSQYPKGRRGVFAKNVLLGTGHELPVKFLTAEDKLLEVLQVTGILVDARGRVIRAGAEGILARDTPFLAQSFETAKVLDEAALHAALSTEKRNDLPGAPLSLIVAVDNLVGQLMQDPRRVLRPL